MTDRKRRGGSDDRTQEATATRTTNDLTEESNVQKVATKKSKEDSREKDEEQRDIFFGEEQPLKGYENVPKWMDPDEKRPALLYGCEISTELNKYRVAKRLSSGGFGDVYAVRRATDGALLALKSEFHIKNNLLQRLKREVLFYEVVNATRREEPLAADHVLYMVDRGHNPWFKFIVMPYTGKSLDLIREKVIKREFTSHTAIRISSQTHTALKNMHAMGYIHRDIKLDNFVVGKEHFRNQLFIMDFGMATNFTEEEDKKHSEYGFIGTDKYAARAVHEGLVAHRRDDMESWLYTIMDAFGTAYVPWEGVNSKDKIYYLKNRFFSGDFDDLLKNVFPRQIFKLRQLIDEVKGADSPNYEAHERELEEMVAENKVDMDAPWEWTQEVAGRMDETDWDDMEEKPKKGKK